MITCFKYFSARSLDAIETINLFSNEISSYAGSLKAWEAAWNDRSCLRVVVRFLCSSYSIIVLYHQQPIMRLIYSAPLRTWPCIVRPYCIASHRVGDYLFAASFLVLIIFSLKENSHVTLVKLIRHFCYQEWGNYQVYSSLSTINRLRFAFGTFRIILEISVSKIQ